MDAPFASLLPHHAKLLEDSAITLEVARARGYKSVEKLAELRRLGFSDAQSRVPGLLIPIHNVAGEVALYQLRPDTPRVRDGKAVKYETISRSRMVLDIPPPARQWLGDPAQPLFITEGVRKADAAVSAGLCCVDVLGVWNWRGTNEHGGKVALADWESIALNQRQVLLVFDSDILEKWSVHLALSRLKELLSSRGADVRVVYLPPGPQGTKTGLDDFLANGHSVKDLRALATRVLRQPPEPATELPTIHLGGRLSEVSDEMLRVLGQSSSLAPRLFQQGGTLVRLRFDDEGSPRVEILGVDALRGELDRVSVWVDSKGNLVPPRIFVVKHILALPHYDLPRLRAAAEAPFFDNTGRLVAEEGYDTNSQIFLHLSSEFDVPRVPTQPSDADIGRARTLILNDLLGDFPFADQSSRAHAVGLLVAPFVRDLIDGPVPMHGIDSPMPATGKGLLADVVSLVVTGRAIEVMAEAKDTDEVRKRITALLRNGCPFALLDNLTQKLDSDGLAAMLTATTWRDRILGASRMIQLPNRTIWMVTGNNLDFSRDLVRRTIWIRLDARSPEPHLRTNFRHDPIRGWLRQERGQLVWAVLVLIQNWIAAGRVPFTAVRLGSYEIWSEVIGGVLTAAGIPGFLGNLDAFSAKADPGTVDWNAFVEAWWKEHHNIPVDTMTLHPLAVVLVPEIVGGGSEHSQRTRLGKAVRKRVGWRVRVTTDEANELVHISQSVVRHEKGRGRNGWALVRQSTHQVPDDVGTLGQQREIHSSVGLLGQPHGPGLPAAMSSNVGHNPGESKSSNDSGPSKQVPQDPNLDRPRHDDTREPSPPDWAEV